MSGADVVTQLVRSLDTAGCIDWKCVTAGENPVLSEFASQSAELTMASEHLVDSSRLFVLM